ncbi:hypothetical protein WN943_010668 [Citrus x changshan-huyou]
MAATPNRQFKNICVLSGFTYGKHKEFVEAAIDLDRSIAARKLHLVYEGGNRGLSKMVSEAAFIRGSQVLGIIPRVLKPLGSSSDSSTREELVVSVLLPGDLVRRHVKPIYLRSPELPLGRDSLVEIACSRSQDLPPGQGSCSWSPELLLG